MSNEHDVERVTTLFLSQDEANIRLAFQLEKGMQLDLTDFWDDLKELYALTQNKWGGDKRSWLQMALPEYYQTLTLSSRHVMYEQHINPHNRFLPRVEVLSLTGNNNTCLPAWIGAFRHIHTLKLAGYQLRHLPDSLQYLQQLKRLELHRQPLEQLPDYIADMQGLEVLALNNMRLQTLPDFIQRMPQLRCLYLRCNEIKVLPDWLGSLPNLRLLDLRANKLTQLPASMAQLAHLQKIYLSDNPNMDWRQALMAIRDLPRLKYLQWMDGDAIDLSGAIATCVSFDLTNNRRVKDWDLYVGALAGSFGELEEITFDNCNLKHIPKSIADFSKLSKLSIYNNQQVKELPAFLLAMSQLKCLDIRCTGIDAIPPDFLAKKDLEIIQAYIPKA